MILLHEILTHEKSSVSQFPEVDHGVRMADAAFADMHRLFGEVSGQDFGHGYIRDEGSQVAVVDSIDIGTEIQRCIQFFQIVNLKQHFK